MASFLFMELLVRKTYRKSRPVEQGSFNDEQQTTAVGEVRSFTLDVQTEQAFMRITQEFGKALDRSNDIGEVKGRLTAVEQQVRHQEVRTDVRFDKNEAKMDAGFNKMETALGELTKVVANINKRMAQNDGERKGITGTVVVIATVVAGAFATIEFLIQLWFRSQGG